MVDNLEDAKEQIKDYFANKKELKEALENDEAHDIIHEIADSNCDVYNSALLNWAKDNYHYIEDAIQEFGFPEDSESKPDFLKAIMIGQYQANSELLREALEELKEEN